MACDPFESLLDRVFNRSKPGDTLLSTNDGEYEVNIKRSALGVTITNIWWWPSMGSSSTVTELDEAAARTQLRTWYGTEVNEGRASMEYAFPDVDPEDE